MNKRNVWNYEQFRPLKVWVQVIYGKVEYCIRTYQDVVFYAVYKYSSLKLYYFVVVAVAVVVAVVVVVVAAVVVVVIV